ncbi:nucleoside 2-deoxyribosyltransferase [Latilactobacillus sakei]|uniref:nucleoside 2-deoxyribosyltransferase n=1 Tax=Latilactobacillus sakei TaxID=1599 RepID=UPI003D00FA86
MKIYFANALFSQADFDYNMRVVATLRQAIPTLDIYLPQENAAINDKEAYANSEMIAQADTEQLVASDLVIAGPTIDVGVASEIGVAYARNIPIIGLYTDSRQQGTTNSQKVAALQTIAENQFHYLNLYTVGLIKLNGTIVNSVDTLIETVQKY